MNRSALLAGLALMSATASAQLRVLSIVQRAIPGARQPVPVVQGIDAMRSDFLVRSGSATVYFGINNAQLGEPAKATLAAQAQWLLAHPEIVVRIEGYGDPGDTRDHSLAIGARRAGEVRDYLVLMGIPQTQVSIVSWGKERPGVGRTVTVLVR
jgi:peptidoglycan-associated lipoprotein